MKTSALICFNILIFFCSLIGRAQSTLYTLDELDTVYTFTNLEEAQLHPEQVIKLKLKKNKLKEVPTEVLTFQNLQYLDLSKNKLDSLNGKIGSLSQLQVLILSKNRLSSLPDEIGQLSNLKRLRAGENLLVELTPEIGKLQQLEYLDLWSNDLTEMPREFEDLKNLKELDLRVNAIKQEEQLIIQDYIPGAKMHFSYDCQCY